ncbi:hypothetical protein HNR42_001940 [Deinobacterium chartae]|uniref:Uncharacterized protein n=1 Tax=Deinobacterium chartae TaxID=521158 RepID=A0A841I065_9DEIO|nr:hypothetical protein [Deinobacterium chartae]MBB6098506.1 hypothetical protein [Deinobacterium chartae]
MRRLLAMVLLCGSALAATPATPINSSPQVQSALEETRALLSLPVACGEPEAWQIDGDVTQIGQFLLDQIEARNWSIMHHQPLSLSYAVIADPNPDDPDAIALGGITLDAAQHGIAFLSECRLADNSGTLVRR